MAVANGLSTNGTFAIAHSVRAVALACTLWSAVACTGVRVPDPSNAPLTPTDLARFAPLPTSLPAAQTITSNAVAAARVELGRALFHETGLSDGHDVACSSCHSLDAWGADGRRVSRGHDGRAGFRNAPSVYNAAGHVAQYWDGRAKDVEAQAMGPILNPIEFGMQSSEAVIRKLRNSPRYVAAFRAAFAGEAEPITYDNVGRAIGAFERGLLTPGRWDQFLEGVTTALTPEEQRGLKTFIAVGCANCHAGTFVGGDRYAIVGEVRPWPTSLDSGRYQITGRMEDLFVFKVPSLRNVAMTAPYFHDGSVRELPDAVRMMANHQLGITLTPIQVERIVAYLNSLTGTVPSSYIASYSGLR